ncbi:Tetratricopeptide repeat protein [Vibrio crassostreae]|nr:Tetratricopeptide repeat protein [Vibrio crassostreae]CAK1712520.1 Tetratricopeptide repeat protein [Vibrio crassostreae]CAK2533588.1 Tetratricopeptide repeat protein [Vibrio crassostreae]CAK2541352.1 Tetratricopeptide repeat protein [Vibrio crassostreae]CAK2596510.1 Tetratricopeptide repeat protein [Vibrio crassostreae]
MYNLDKIVFRVTSEDKSIQDSGTAFLINNNHALTAYHVIKNFSDKTIILTNGNIKYKAKLSKDTTEKYKSLDVALLELCDELSDIDYPLFSYNNIIPKGTKWKSRGFPSSKMFDGENINDSEHNTINQHKLTLNNKNVDLFLDHNGKLQNYLGMSGAPLIIDECIVGLIKNDYLQNGKSIELNAISVNYFKDLLPDDIAFYDVPSIELKNQLENKIVFNLPFRAKKEGVIGRENNILELRALLNSNQRTSIGHAISFSGIGGLGKTQLAIEYSYRFRDEYSEGVFWFNADQDIKNQIIKLSDDYEWFPLEYESKYKLELAIKKFKSLNDALIIFDNVESIDNIEAFFPSVDSSPHILVTCRSKIKGFNHLELELLTYEESKELLLKEANRAHISTVSTNEALDEILEILDGLPLAIEVAGGYLNTHSNITLEVYRDFLKQDFEEIISKDEYSSFTKHQIGILKTLSISDGMLQPSLKKILVLLTWSAPGTMSESLLLSLLENDISIIDFQSSISSGLSLKILKKTNDGRYSIHRLIREVEQLTNPIDENLEFLKLASFKMYKWFNKRKIIFSELCLYESEMENLKYWSKMASIKEWTSAPILAWLQSYPYLHHSNYQQNLELLHKALEMSHNVKTSPSMLGNIYRDIGANPLTKNNNDCFRAALSYYNTQEPIIIKRSLAKLHNFYGIANVSIPEVAKAHYDKALKIYIELVDDGERSYSYYVAQCYHNISSYYIDSMREGITSEVDNSINKAIFYQMKAIRLWKELLGDKHPRLATAFSNLGYYNLLLGKDKESLKYYNVALRDKKELLHSNHQEIGVSLYNIGSYYHKKGDFQSSLPFFEDAFVIFSNEMNITMHEMEMIRSFSCFIKSLLKLGRTNKAAIELNKYRKLNLFSGNYIESIVNIERAINDNSKK